MYELVKVNDNTYYLASPSVIGIYTPDGKNAYAIDTGNGETSAKKLLSAVDSLGLTLKAILNTHSHADHTGGNALCQQRTGCKVYSPGREMYYTNTPSLEPVYLFGGFAPKKLMHNFFTAMPSNAETLSDAVLPDGLSAIELHGHSYDQVGYRTRDGIVFLGDALVSERTLEKYRITFNYDIAAALATLERIKEMDAKLFIPCHALATPDIAPLAQVNIDSIKNIINTLLSLISEPKTFEDLLSEVFSVFEMEMNDAQFALIGFTVRSYLVYCENEGLASHFFAGNRMMWKATGN